VPSKSALTPCPGITGWHREQTCMELQGCGGLNRRSRDVAAQTWSRNRGNFDQGFLLLPLTFLDHRYRKVVAVKAVNS
jgi:hypothetical protein